jgi:hypothetical protein
VLSKNQQQWPPISVPVLERELDRLADAVMAGDERELNEQMWLSRFLVVRACGYLEQCVHLIVTEHVQVNSWGTVRSFAISWMPRSRTPSAENLMEVLGRLDAALQEEFETLLAHNDGELRQRLALLVGRRHQIAHGQNEGMGTQSALELYRAAKVISDWFVRRFAPYAEAKTT